MLCKRCGKEITNNMKYCSYCGKRIRIPENVSKKNINKAVKRSTIVKACIYIFINVIILLICSVCWSEFQNCSDSIDYYNKKINEYQEQLNVLNDFSTKFEDLYQDAMAFEEKTNYLLEVYKTAWWGYPELEKMRDSENVLEELRELNLSICKGLTENEEIIKSYSYLWEGDVSRYEEIVSALEKCKEQCDMFYGDYSDGDKGPYSSSGEILIRTYSQKIGTLQNIIDLEIDYEAIANAIPASQEQYVSYIQKETDVISVFKADEMKYYWATYVTFVLAIVLFAIFISLLIIYKKSIITKSKIFIVIGVCLIIGCLSSAIFLMLSFPKIQKGISDEQFENIITQDENPESVSE